MSTLHWGAGTSLYTTTVTAKTTRSPALPLLLPALLVLLPPIAFYAVLGIATINFPLRDDYDTILNFANGLAGQSALHGKIALLLASQSNEYKLYILHIAVWLQASVTHHVDFRVLIGLGDVFVLLLGLLLWKQLLPGCSDLRRKLIYFVPISCLLFELRYQEATDWATAALQHMPCLFFSFAAIYLVRSQSRGKFCLGLVCVALAIFSSGNGFLVVPVGLVSLILDRKFTRAIGWMGVFAACAAIYFQHYTRTNLQAKQGVAFSLFHVHPVYFLLFLGSIVARPYLAAGVLLGLALCVLVAYFAFTGSLRQPTSTAYCMLYLMLTALVVAAMRGDVDAMQISTSRYTIYSALVLIFSWMLALERQGSDISAQGPTVWLTNTVVAASVLFAASTYVTGYRAIQKTNQALIKGMTWYEHPTASDEVLGPVVPLSTDDDEQRVFHIRAGHELTRSIELGLYAPPPP